MTKGTDDKDLADGLRSLALKANFPTTIDMLHKAADRIEQLSSGGWMPIESAPKDGTRVLITDGKLFTAAKWSFYEEKPTTSLGYGDPETGIPEGGYPKHPGHAWSMEQVPNPKAGERHYSWYQDNPVAFAEDDCEGPDYDGNFENLVPTHWQPLPSPPALQSLQVGGGE